MNKKVVKRLRQVANQLPPIPQRKPSEIKTGQELIDEGTTETKDGKKIDPKKNYYGWQIAPMDHLNRLKKVYMKGGNEAVTRYAGEAVRLFARLQKEVRDREEKKKTEKVI